MSKSATLPEFTTTHARHGMVSAPHHLAAQSGARILAEGGTAIEAALAVAAMLTVVYPHMTSLGGDMFWLLAEPGSEPIIIDGAGRAGGAFTPSLYTDRGLGSIPWRGALAANTVAGAVASWDAAWAENGRWGGRMPLSRVVEDAVCAARDGIQVTAGHADALRQFRGELEPVPGFAALHLPDGAAPRAGEMLRQPALARTYRKLATDGLDGFYRGALARQIGAELEAAGVLLRGADLEAQRAQVGRPLSLRLPMAEVFNCPPPTQGLASLMILGLYAQLGIAEADSFAYIHGIVESTKHAFALRDRLIGDPRPGAALERHLDPSALAQVAGMIDRGRAAPWNSGADGDTVWFGAIDRAGRAVSAIQSLYFEFGSGIGLPESGFVWQNRGTAFRLSGGGPNVLGPGRKPFHTLNPALARFADGRTMVYGAMGGDGQPQTQAAIFTRYAFHGQDLQDAISAPRWVLGRTWRDSASALRIESRFPDALLQALRRAGHDVLPVAPLDPVMGHAGAVVLQANEGGYLGASDPRSDGAARGC